MLVWGLLILAAWIGVIFYFGTGRWGRAQTQSIIDRLRRHPRVHAFLDRHHGKLRASFHYLEFGGLTLILYFLASFFFKRSPLAWDGRIAAAVAVVSAVAAFLDELHQLQSGTRQFRRVDYFHSCCGIAIALFILRYLALIVEG